MGSPIDHKNIGLAKLLSELRQDLDIFCLVSVNVDSIKKHGVGLSFFWHLRALIIKSITINIYKIYEEERTHELNSIHGVFRHLSVDAKTISNDEKLEAFIQKYNGPLTMDNAITALGATIKRFRKRYRDELDRFGIFRKKKVAHDEFGFTCDSLPSYGVMQKLFDFGADFYGLVSRSFVGVIPHDFKSQEPVKNALINIFRELGIEDIKTDME
jgi:hypothetical protein